MVLAVIEDEVRHDNVVELARRLALRIDRLQQRIHRRAPLVSLQKRIVKKNNGKIN